MATDQNQPPPRPLHKSEARFCPSCGSPAVTIAELAGSDSECRVCHFKGSLSAFPVRVFFTERPINVDEMLQTMANDMRAELGSNMARALANFLNRWGFLPWDANEQAPLGSKKYNERVAVMTLYGRNAAQALLSSVLHTREELERLGRERREKEEGGARG